MTSALNILSKIQQKVPQAVHAFFHVDLGYVVHQHLNWKKYFPRVEPFYAVKCQPDPRVINVLSRLGVSFDCSSQAEIEMVLQNISNKDKHRIILSNPFKFRKDIQYAADVGVELTSFDSISEVEKLKHIWPHAKLMLRVAATNAKEQIRSLSNTEKFGAQLHNIPILLNKARELDFEVVGLSFHAGIMCDDMEAWSRALDKSRQVKELMIKNGIKPKIINIGGGFPAKSLLLNDASLKQEIEFKRVCFTINKQLDEIYPAEDDYRILATPGRFYVYGAFTLATQIIGRRVHDMKESRNFKPNRSLHFGHLDASDLVNVVNSFSHEKTDYINPDKGFIYIIDDGIYGSFNILMFSDYSFSLLGILDVNGNMKSFNNCPRYKSKVYGPTCDTFDCIFPSVELPELSTDNWLVWGDMGAYTNASRTGFNGIISPNIYYSMSKEDEELFSKHEIKN